MAEMEAVTPESIMEAARLQLSGEPCVAILGRDAEGLRL